MDRSDRLRPENMYNNIIYMMGTGTAADSRTPSSSFLSLFDYFFFGIQILHTTHTYIHINI